eukprot:Lankesteria_metandrocarpae@DN5486_c0_g1_i8.p1
MKKNGNAVVLLALLSVWILKVAAVGDEDEKTETNQYFQAEEGRSKSPIESEAELREPSFTPENVHEYANETITRPRSAHLSPTPNDSTSSAHLSPTHEGNNCQQLERTQKILPPRCNGRRVRFMDYEDMKRKTPRRIPVQ